MFFGAGKGPKHSFCCWLDFVLWLAGILFALSKTVLTWKTFYVAVTLMALINGL